MESGFDLAKRLFGYTPDMNQSRKIENKITNPPSSFNGSLSLGGSNNSNFIESVFMNFVAQNDVMKHFNSQLYNEFVPDIGGYVLAFFVPPPLLGLTSKDNTYITNFRKNSCFNIIDIVPPQNQVQTEKITTRTGGVPIATEVSTTEQLSMTFLEDINLNIYNYHYNWVSYIDMCTQGIIEPPSVYMNYDDEDMYGALDYAGSCFIVKFTPDMNSIQFVSKATGIFPQGLPSKELIGTRATNDNTQLSFSYFCTQYEEALDKEHIIYKELMDRVISVYGKIDDSE